MTVAVANSSEMEQSKLAHISAIQKLCASVSFCNVTFLEALAHLGSSKVVWGCFWWQIFRVFPYSLKEILIARLPLRLWPAKMILSTWPFATSHRMASIDATSRQRYRIFFLRRSKCKLDIAFPPAQICKPEFNIHRNLTHSLGNARTWERCKFSSSNLIFRVSTCFFWWF